MKYQILSITCILLCLFTTSALPSNNRFWSGLEGTLDTDYLNPTSATISKDTASGYKQVLIGSGQYISSNTANQPTFTLPLSMTFYTTFTTALME